MHGELTFDQVKVIAIITFKANSNKTTHNITFIGHRLQFIYVNKCYECNPRHF